MRTSKSLIECTSDGRGLSLIRCGSSSLGACGTHKPTHVGPTKGHKEGLDHFNQFLFVFYFGMIPIFIELVLCVLFHVL